MAAKETKWKGNQITGESDRKVHIQSSGYKKGKT